MNGKGEINLVFFSAKAGFFLWQYYKVTLLGFRGRQYHPNVIFNAKTRWKYAQFLRYRLMFVLCLVSWISQKNPVEISMTALDLQAKVIALSRKSYFLFQFFIFNAIISIFEYSRSEIDYTKELKKIFKVRYILTYRCIGPFLSRSQRCTDT